MLSQVALCPQYSSAQGLLNPAAMARMALGEALTNLTWARATSLADIKASVNWMYAAKLGSEGANMYDAAVAPQVRLLKPCVSSATISLQKMLVGWLPLCNDCHKPAIDADSTTTKPPADSSLSSIFPKDRDMEHAPEAFIAAVVDC